jgi:hypothetical protein
MEEYKGSFPAVREDNGQTVTLHVYQTVVDAGTRRSPGATVRGQRSIRTDDGATVNRLEKGRYEIAESGLLLRSDAEDAP